ncbi:MAG TPA: hypothetical protein VF467_15150 [Afipia sp.]
MPSLEDLEELRLSIDLVGRRAETLGLSDLTYLLKMALLEIVEKQQAEMDRLERDSFRQTATKADLNRQSRILAG